jgi:hypothetical protein
MGDLVFNGGKNALLVGNQQYEPSFQSLSFSKLDSFPDSPLETSQSTTRKSAFLPSGTGVRIWDVRKPGLFLY